MPQQDDPTPPLIIFGDAGPMIFRSVAAACGWLEAPDVLQEIYDGYDSDGRRLEIAAPRAWLTSRPRGWRARLRWDRQLSRENYADIALAESFATGAPVMKRRLAYAMSGDDARRRELRGLGLRDLLEEAEKTLDVVG
jgi:hypothetical protein